MFMINHWGAQGIYIFFYSLRYILRLSVDIIYYVKSQNIVFKKLNKNLYKMNF